jgi:hypothetical protein
MTILFNKSGKGNEELKKLIGWLYKSNKFENIAMDIELAQEEIAKLIGDDVLSRAIVHYTGTSYEADNPTQLMTFNDTLVHYIQLPVALLAYKSYSENADVSHEDTGRKVKINAESEKLPWEWMLDRDNAAILRKAYKTLDRLISFLENNANSIEEWKNSDVRGLMNSLFISRASEFDDIFPIDKSLRFFLKILPFMKEVERKQIRPVIGAELFTQLKERKAAGSLTDADRELLEYVNNAIPFLTMSIATKRLNLQVIPEGVVQSFVTERQTSQAKAVPALELVTQLSRSLQSDGEDELRNLANHLEEVNADPDEVIEVRVEPINDSENKHFTV